MRRWCQKYSSERLKKNWNQRNLGDEADEFNRSMLFDIVLWEVIHQKIVVRLS